MEDNTGAPTTPAPKRQRMARPTGEKRQRRTSTQAKVALAMVETHLAGTYSQMELLEKAVAELKGQLS